MLTRLTVCNLAVVEKAEADFAEGLNVITGETGAGKSVFIGALELLLGGRADSSVVREGAKEARVEAVFELGAGAAGSGVASLLDASGIEVGEEGSLIIRRTVNAGGGGRVWVNDCATTVATLKKIGRLLVDIHGPRANQLILEERFQRATLDSFGGVDSTQYASEWAELEKIHEDISSLEAAESTEDEIDLLKYQVGEIEEAGITEEDDGLAERHAAAAHAGDIVEAANDATEALGGDGGVSELLARAQSRFRSVAKFFPEAESWVSEAEEIAVRADELSRSVAEAASRLDADPDELARMDARLAIVNKILRKYRATDAAGVAEILSQKRSRLDELENRGLRLEQLRQAEARQVAKVSATGATLRAARVKAGVRLGKAVTAELRGLGFTHARFEVSVSESAPARAGCDTVEFVFEPNKGEGARPLAEIASSGEAARVMLALKTVLAAHDGMDLLVFDEIDANIGGETGRAVGERMRAVAAHHQVIAITHLPQSAVFGDRHLVVSKAVSGGRTRTCVTRVDGEAREAEIARMLGGGNAAMEHAKALLDKQISTK